MTGTTTETVSCIMIRLVEENLFLFLPTFRTFAWQRRRALAAATPSFPRARSANILTNSAEKDWHLQVSLSLRSRSECNPGQIQT